VSTVLDALKKLQSERDREGRAGTGARHGDVVKGGSPRPPQRRWPVWLASLAILVMAGAAAGYFFLGNRYELPTLTEGPASSEEADAALGEIARGGARQTAEARSSKATAAGQADPRRDLSFQERVEQQNREILARMQKNLGRGGRGRRMRRELAQARGGSGRPPLAGEERPLSPTPGAGAAAGRAEAGLEGDDAQPGPLVQAEQSAAVSTAEEGQDRGEQGAWAPGSGSVRMAPATPEPPSPKRAPVAAATPAPRPEAAAPTESRPALLEESERATPPEAEASELLDAPLAATLPFPEVSLEAVRWHPDAERREARLVVDNRRPVDVREGDIVAGVAVRRIDPGAVELMLGTSRMLVRIGE